MRRKLPTFSLLAVLWPESAKAQDRSFKRDVEYMGKDAWYVISAPTHATGDDFHRFDLGIAEPAIYVLAAGVGTARIVDGAHWPSDTYTGMAYGFSVGKAVAARQLKRERERLLNGAGTPGLVIGGRITF